MEDTLVAATRGRAEPLYTCVGRHDIIYISNKPRPRARPAPRADTRRADTWHCLHLSSIESFLTEGTFNSNIIYLKKGETITLLCVYTREFNLKQLWNYSVYFAYICCAVVGLLISRVPGNLTNSHSLMHCWDIANLVDWSLILMIHCVVKDLLQHVTLLMCTYYYAITKQKAMAKNIFHW